MSWITLLQITGQHPDIPVPLPGKSPERWL